MGILLHILLPVQKLLKCKFPKSNRRAFRASVSLIHTYIFGLAIFSEECCFYINGKWRLCPNKHVRSWTYNLVRKSSHLYNPWAFTVEKYGELQSTVTSLMSSGVTVNYSLPASPAPQENTVLNNTILRKDQNVSYNFQ